MLMRRGAGRWTAVAMVRSLIRALKALSYAESRSIATGAAPDADNRHPAMLAPPLA